MTILTEALHAGTYLVSERGPFQSRDQITFQPSTTLPAVPGTIIAKTGVPAAETATAAAAAGNTGTGTLTLDGTAPIAASAVDGEYEIEMLTGGASANFQVAAPDGTIVGAGQVGSTFTGPIKFSISAGGTAFVVGDRFRVTVLRPTRTGDIWGPLDTTQSNGLQIAVGVLFGYVPAGPTAVEATAHVRDCEVRAADLTWPPGFTTAQIAEGTNQLRALGIVPR